MIRTQHETARSAQRPVLRPLFLAILGALLLGAAAPAQSATPVSVHVASVQTGVWIVSIEPRLAGLHWKIEPYGTAKVVIVDNLGNPVAGATVKGTFSGSPVPTSSRSVWIPYPHRSPTILART